VFEIGKNHRPNASKRMKKSRIFQGNMPVIILAVFHLVGILGLLSPFAENFKWLTPFHLLLCFVLLVGSQKKYDASFAAFLMLSYLVGFSAEWIGVHKGWLFGDYHYGKVLGPGLDEIPVMIGINWYLLSYSAGQIVAKLKFRPLLTAVLGALLMTGLDFLIEPVAIRLEYWVWETPEIPWTNYLGWFVVSLPLQWASVYWNRENNPVGSWLFVLQLLFFIALNFLN
jgi:bisanhydrobacterioruberin hydratase